MTDRPYKTHIEMADDGENSTIVTAVTQEDWDRLTWLLANARRIVCSECGWSARMADGICAFCDGES